MPQPPKPAALKLLQGNPGGRPIPIEPEPAGDLVKPPGLRGRASDLWDQFAPILVEMGTLKAPDGPLFANWCKLAAMAERRFSKMSTAQLTEMRRIGDTFGMSPTGRAKIGIASAKKPDNPFLKADVRRRSS